MGFGAVLITGIPGYYPKLGFKLASEYGLFISDDTPAEAFMVYELEPGYLSGGGEYCIWAPEFDVAENDDAAYQEFHREFVAEYIPGRLILRKLSGDDIPLVRRWVYSDHIAAWFENPEEWLREIEERYGGFSFITHLIAEIDAKPVGFCQYYDCFYSPAEECIKPETPGETYSLDYLIGEPEYLGRGFGKEMIRQLLDIMRGLGAKEVAVRPDENNQASIRAFLANGFVKTGEYYLFRG
jgi:RimJ/RimL family protein N-acetyltransferase